VREFRHHAGEVSYAQNVEDQRHASIAHDACTCERRQASVASLAA
jgi:hypothetical protein